MRRLVFVLAAVLGAGAGAVSVSARGGGAPACTPGGTAVTFEGVADPATEKTYEELAFQVPDGVTRVEVTYDWVELPPSAGVPPAAGAPADSTFDLGLWDEDGVGEAEGFRGWSGSRGGRTSTGQAPVFVQADVAARGYAPAPIEAGMWTVDLGIAALSAGGASWTVTIACSEPVVGPAFEPAPVDADHVAATEPGWYHGDFHMHGFHSNAQGPEHQALVDLAVAAGLDIVFLTEYVTGQHWDELGPVQEANPDVLIWPGREIITYFGHANALGETPSVLDWRHGADGVTLADIQAATVADGALFQVNHPTIFPEAQFGSACRGCEFTLDDLIDWDLVTTFEVLTGPIDTGGDAPVQNPFVQTAIDEWEALLLEGHRITAVSGSDSKGQEDDDADRARVGYGSSATAVFAEELSRSAVAEALEAGHAYIRTRGALRSPEVDMVVTGADGTTGMVGDTVVGESATLEVTVRGAGGQQLLLTQDGEPSGEPVAIDADPFTFTAELARSTGSGPLGTFFRIDTRDALALTTIGNPVFLADQPVTTTTAQPGEPDVSTPPVTDAREEDADDGGGLGVGVGAAAVLVAIVAAADGARRWRRRP